MFFQFTNECRNHLDLFCHLTSIVFFNFSKFSTTDLSVLYSSCCLVLFYIRLLKILLARQSMHWNSMLKIFFPHLLPSSSTPCMIHTVKVQTSFVDIPSASEKVLKQQFLMAFGLTFPIMMLPHSLSSLLRGTKGTHR